MSKSSSDRVNIKKEPATTSRDGNGRSRGRFHCPAPMLRMSFVFVPKKRGNEGRGKEDGSIVTAVETKMAAFFGGGPCLIR